MPVNYRQIKAIEKKNKERILAACPSMPDTSGIYFFTRSEDGFKYAYIGQACRLLTRAAQHLSGYQHIDLSIKKHGLYSADNPCGYEINFLTFPLSELDEKEQYFIKKYAAAGYQLRNKTSGSQGAGKRGLDDQKAPRGYRDGLKQGYKNARKEVAHLFDLHLTFSQKSPKPNKNQAKAVEKFKEFLDVDNISD